MTSVIPQTFSRKAELCSHQKKFLNSEKPNNWSCWRKSARSTTSKR